MGGLGGFVFGGFGGLGVVVAFGGFGVVLDAAGVTGCRFAFRPLLCWFALLACGGVAEPEV